MSGELLFALVAIAFVAAALALAHRLGAGSRRGDLVALGLDALRAELARLSRQHELLRDDVQRARESSSVGLARATESIRGDLGAARRTLTEVRAFGQGWSRELARAGESLRRVEAVFAGSATRGAAGEKALERALGQLPADMLETNVPFGSRVVEYALRLPDGRLLPVDSKWSSAGTLERLAASDDPDEQRRLRERACRELLTRARELTRYLDPERTLGVAVLAVPDAVHAATRGAHAEGYREGALIVPYSLALSYVLALYRISLRFGPSAGAPPVAARVRELEASLAALEDEVEGRLSRGLAQLGNARDATREALSRARRASAGLLDAREPAPAGPAGSGRRTG